MKKSRVQLLFNIILFMIVVCYVVISKPNTKLSVKSNYFEGIITNYKIDGDKLSLEVKGKERIIANYYIKTIKEKEYLENNIMLGSKMKLSGEFSHPNKNSIPNTFNYKKYLKSKKIYLIMNTKKYVLTKHCNIFYKLKNSLIKYIKNKKHSEYYYTFILGDKNQLDEEVYNSYKTNGITHLFAISGMHISYLVLILNKFK